MKYVDQHLKHLLDLHKYKANWSVTRAWSQGMFDRFETGVWKWDDYLGAIHRDRTDRAIEARDCKQSTASSNIEIVCSDFNGKGCYHQNHHDTPQGKMVHYCTWCFSGVGGWRKHGHPLMSCRQKPGAQKQNNYYPPSANTNAMPPSYYPPPQGYSNLRPQAPSFNPTKNGQ